MSHRTRVKVCGITNIADALACAELGVDAIGLNFVPESPRFVDRQQARVITAALAELGPKQPVLIVGVVADLTLSALQTLLHEVPLGCLQLHGNESPATLRALLPHVYKAFRIRTAEDLAAIADYPGEHVLVDAHVEGVLGGTGQTIQSAIWPDLQALGRSRKLTIAGGLTPANVGGLVRAMGAALYCVDVASGVEASRGMKDREKIAAFVQEVRACL